ILLTVVAQFFRSSSSQPWWQVAIGIMAIASLVALWMEMRTQRVPKPHPLRRTVNDFICDLSEANQIDESLVVRAKELQRAFQREGVYHQHFPRFDRQVSMGDLEQAAVCFHKMLAALPY
ncbi:MAG: hypothetical protein WCC59_03360, partial [Terriglobales bacterium]